MTRPLADPALTAQFHFDQYHAELIETLDELGVATANLVDAQGEYLGLAAMTAYLIDKFGEVPVLASLLTIAMHRGHQRPAAG